MRIIFSRRKFNLAAPRAITCYFHHLHRVVADYLSEIPRLARKPIAGVGTARLNRQSSWVKRRPISSTPIARRAPNDKQPRRRKANRKIITLLLHGRRRDTRDVNLLFKAVLEEHQQAHTRRLLVSTAESMISTAGGYG